MFQEIVFWNNYWRIIAEIAILWFVIYRLLVFAKNTRAFPVLKGLVILIFIFFLTELLGLKTIYWLMTRLFAISVIAFVIIFQPELRRLLARIGQERLFMIPLREEQVVSEITDAIFELARKRIGALIALERDVSLHPYTESGTIIDSKVSKELVSSIFMPASALHDGAIIIEKDRIFAAGCLFPLSQNPRISKTLGTRHRAALGLTEETDAAVVISSEETGSVSVSISGKLTRDLDKDALTKILYGLYRLKKKKKSFSELLRGKKKTK